MDKKHFNLYDTLYKTKDKIRCIGFENIVVKGIIALIFASLLQMLIIQVNFTEFQFWKNANILLFIGSMIVSFIILLITGKPIIDKLLFIWSALLYCLFAIVENKDIYFAIGCCVVMGVVILYAFTADMHFEISKVSTMTILSVLAIGSILFIGGITTVRYLSHWTPNYDFGIFAQMYTYMKETFMPMTTCERDMLVSHFYVHFSPIFYVLLPIYYVFPSPVTLMFGQALVIASGLIPLYLLTKKYHFSNIVTILISLIYILLPSLVGGSFYYIHENQFLTPLILWLFYFIEKNNGVGTVSFALLVMLVKEDAPVYVAFVALYFILSKRNVKKGAVLLVLSIVYFITVIKLLSIFGEGAMFNRFDNYNYDQSGSVLTLIKAVLLNPIYVIRECFKEKKFLFMVQMFLPMAFVPLMINKPSKLILLCPLILINLMPDYGYMYNVGYQYTYGSSAFLIYLFIINYVTIKKPWNKKILMIAVMSSIILFTSQYFDKINTFRSYLDNIEEHKTIDSALDMIPEDASVKASTFLVANLFDHKELYELETTKHETEYVVLDLRYESKEHKVEQYQNDQYETIFLKDNIIGVFRKKL